MGQFITCIVTGVITQLHGIIGSRYQVAGDQTVRDRSHGNKWSTDRPCWEMMSVLRDSEEQQVVLFEYFLSP